MQTQLAERKIVTEMPAVIVKTERDVRKQKLRMAAYCRVSTDSEDQLNSYNSQIKYYTSIIEENPNWTMAGIFADEGLSGGSTKKRKEFNRMMQKCRAGRIDMIIVKSVSRFARNTLDSISWARRLKKLGIGIIFENEGVNTMEMDDEILLAIFAGLAQAESESLTKQSKKNNGELPQYYITNNHPAIIDRDIFQKVQEEIARRGCKRKVQSKSARTEQSKYSGKYALNEILVCGECGTPYRRVTWTQHGERRIVWRCISRLEHGRKYCKESPTLHESPLHAAVMDAISEVVDHEALRCALRAGLEAAYTMDKETIVYRMAKTRVEELKAQFDKLLESAGTAGFDEDYYDQRIKKIGDEMAAKRAVIEGYEARQEEKSRQSEIAAASELLEDEPFTLPEYDDQAVRQLVDTIRVVAKDRITVTLKGGMEIEQRIEA